MINGIFAIESSALNELTYRVKTAKRLCMYVQGFMSFYITNLYQINSIGIVRWNIRTWAG